MLIVAKTRNPCENFSHGLHILEDFHKTEVTFLIVCVADSIDNVAHFLYNAGEWRDLMNKTISMSIRVSEEELDRIKTAAQLLSYSSYSEFVRRTALMEASKIIKGESESRDGGKQL